MLSIIQLEPYMSMAPIRLMMELGPSPPLATYYYQFTYTSEIDYVYDTSSSEIVALPLGNLINLCGTVSFQL